MGEGIEGPPNVYNFGHEFDYAVWTPGTTVDLTNVPWDNNYRDIVKFDNRAQLNDYIDNGDPTRMTINQLSYLKPNEPVRLRIPHNVAIKYNYLRASNPAQPVPNDVVKQFYYFILDVQYIAPETTELILQLDLVQTYIYDVTFGNCYVERGHIGIANENAFDNYGRDYLTVPEGFDLGNEYRVVNAKNKMIMNPASPVPIPGDTGDTYVGFDVLVFSTTDLYADPGTAENPNLTSANGTVFQNTMQGANVWVFDPQDFFAFMNAAKDTPWVTQGIVSITMIPRITRYYPDFEYAAGVGVATEAVTNMPATVVYEMANNWRSDDFLEQKIPERYRHLKKFYTSPYMIIEMTTFSGTPLVLRPEAWNDPHAKVFERISMVPPGSRIEFSPRYYNADVRGVVEDLYPPPLEFGYEGDDNGEYLDMVTQIANFPTMSIVNDGQISYLAANVHGIAYQRQSADWTQQRALGMNQAEYDIATQAMHTLADLSGTNVNAAADIMANNNRNIWAQSIVQGATGTGSIAGGAAFGGGAGAAAGAVQAVTGMIGSVANAAFQTSTNEQNNAVGARAAAETLISQQKQGQVVRDTNKNVSDWAARGDYANTIAGVNARVQDAAMIQPTTSGQISGETINMINGGWRLSLRWKMIDKASMRRVGDYWLRYGYAIRAFIKMPAGMHVMTKFTYWKLSETYITAGAIPEGHKQGIRGIFEKGVTLWRDPDDIGQIDIADNMPLGGISY